MTLSALIPPLDAAWLVQESGETPMHVATLQVFESPAQVSPTYLRDLVGRWRDCDSIAAPFNYRVRGGLVPRWELLHRSAIDLDYHLRHTALPAPGDERQLGTLVSRLHSSRLNRRYPLWECHVIEGLADGRWALYFKVHHSLMDGVAGLRLSDRALSSDPTMTEPLPLWAVGFDGPDQSGLDRTTATTSPRGPAESRLLANAVHVAGALGGQLLRAAGGGDAQRTAAYRNPATVLNARLQAPRRVATQQYANARLLAVARAAEATQNDVLLALCGGALRRYLAKLGSLPSSSLTALVPVAVRRRGAPGGNAITFLLAQLGTDVANPVERLARVHASVAQAKGDLPDVPTGAMSAYTGLLMTPLIAQGILHAGGRTPPMANVVISNVPGLREDRFLAGSRLAGFYPFSVLVHGQGLNITAISGRNTTDLGFTGCRETVPHLQRIATYCADALAELEVAFGIEPTSN